MKSLGHAFLFALILLLCAFALKGMDCELKHRHHAAEVEAARVMYERGEVEFEELNDADLANGFYGDDGAEMDVENDPCDDTAFEVSGKTGAL